MKTVEISTASRSLAEYANELGDDFVVLTSNSKPVAAIVSLKNVDPESLALSTNAEFGNYRAGTSRVCIRPHDFAEFHEEGARCLVGKW